MNAKQLMLMNALKAAAVKYHDERGSYPPYVFLSKELILGLFPNETSRKLSAHSTGPTQIFLTNIGKTLEMRTADPALGVFFNMVGTEQDYQDAIVEYHLLLDPSQPDTDSIND